MSKIILPDIVHKNADIERRLEHIKELRERGAFLREFDRQLKEIDPRLSLVKARESSDIPELMPGYWHVQRDNEGAPNSYFPIADIDGNFVEPNSGMLEHLKKQDLQRPGALEELRKTELRKMEAREKEKLRAREERVGSTMERYKHLSGTSISLVKSLQGWKNSVRGRG